MFTKFVLCSLGLSSLTADINTHRLTEYQLNEPLAQIQLTQLISERAGNQCDILCVIQLSEEDPEWSKYVGVLEIRWCI